MVLILQVVGASSLGQGASVRFGTWVLVEDAVPDVYGLVSFGLWALMPCKDVFVCGRSRRCRVQRAPLTDVHGHVHFGAWVLAPLQSATACLLVVRGL